MKKERICILLNSSHLSDFDKKAVINSGKAAGSMKQQRYLYSMLFLASPITLTFIPNPLDTDASSCRMFP